MEFIDQHWLGVSGGVLILVGLLLRWRTGRYDLKDELIDSAWQVARGKRSAENPTAVEERLKDLAAQPGTTGKLRSAGGAILGHFLSQVFAVVALIMMLAGVVMIGLEFYWR